MKVIAVPVAIPADASWSIPSDREIQAEHLRRARFALARQLSENGPADETLCLKADRINTRLAICDAARIVGSDPARERALWRLNTLAKELMADHVDEAVTLAARAPAHPMISTFLIGASQHAEHAWETRGAQHDLPGPFGALQQLAWFLSRPEAKLDTTALPFLDAAVQSARAIPSSASLKDWRMAEVGAFVTAWGSTGKACLR